MNIPAYISLQGYPEKINILDSFYYGCYLF